MSGKNNKGIKGSTRYENGIVPGEPPCFNPRCKEVGTTCRSRNLFACAQRWLKALSAFQDNSATYQQYETYYRFYYEMYISKNEQEKLEAACPEKDIQEMETILQKSLENLVENTSNFEIIRPVKLFSKKSKNPRRDAKNARRISTFVQKYKKTITSASESDVSSILNDCFDFHELIERRETIFEDYSDPNADWYALDAYYGIKSDLFDGLKSDTFLSEFHLET
jgi:hypothetical protein